jgi:CubicO group peptidase (beta-lactamase class C family)
MAAVASPQQPDPSDRGEMAAFLDDLVRREMETNHIAGAAISVVEDGKLFFTKGYGYADLHNRIPVDPETTNFRIGSLAKLFTWTAVMQLVEQGRLDLNADVNSYLDFRVPKTYARPITLRDLLTHTAGFEDLYYERLATDEHHLQSPRTWLVSHMPARVRPPGELAAYSSYGAGLAGYIVARVSGEPYARYVQDHILGPLGMSHTTAQPSMPPDIRAHTSVGYVYEHGAYSEFPDRSQLTSSHLPYADMGQPALVPAGDMQASATDMARFMIAQLEDARPGAVLPARRILDRAAARLMHATAYTADPRLLGTTYGFFDFSDNGQRTIGHNGESDPIESLLLLLPDKDMGVFVVYNSEGGSDLIHQHLGFQRAFFDHYFPAPAVQQVRPPAGFAQQAERFEGTYRITGGEIGTSYTTLEKFGMLFGSTVTVRDRGDGTPLLETPWANWRFVEVSPRYFRQVNRPFHILFAENDAGHVTKLFTDYTPMFAFEKLPWYATPRFSMGLLLGCVLLFLSVLPVALISLVSSRRHRDRPPVGRRARVARGVLVGLSATNLLFVLGTALWFNPVPVFGISATYKLVLGLGALSPVLTIAAILGAVATWRNRYWRIATRVHYTLVVVASVAFIWFLNFWNLLGWRY